MLRTALTLCVLASSTIAVAGESNDEDITFSGTGQLFNGLEYDTGVYEIVDEAGLRFFVDAGADVTFDMEGRSSLTWPQALTNSWDQTDHGGSISIDTTTDIVAQVAGSIWGIPFTYNIWSESISWNGTETFSSILMPKARQPQVNVQMNGEDFVAFEETVQVADGLTITLGGKVFPQLDATLTGTSIESDNEEVTSLNEEVQLKVPNANPGYVGIDSTWKGVLNGKISLMIVPWVTVYYKDWGLEIGPIEYDIPIDLFDDSTNVQSDKTRYNHDLPAIQTNAVSIDFGQVTVGEVVTKELQITNLGEVALTGDASTKDDHFFMSDAIIDADELSHDTVTVDFVATEAGTFTGKMLLLTNDPIRPQLTIPLVGTATEAPVSNPNNDDPNNPSVSAPVGCGCSVAPLSTAPFGLLPLLGMAGLFIRRRRS